MARLSQMAMPSSMSTGTRPEGESARARCLKADCSSKLSKRSMTSSKAMPAWRISTQGRMDQDE